MNLPQDPLSKLIFELSKLPGVGEKSATRLAYFILRQDMSYAQGLSDALLESKKRIQPCEQCFTFTDIQPCRICSSTSRDRSVICVVEKPSDVLSLDRTSSFNGVYHVLHGVLSPLDGVGPEDLKIRELIERVSNSEPRIREVILALNPSVESDTTTLYLYKLLQPIRSVQPFKVSRLAHGIPVGGQLEYSDRQTITKALENRLEMA